MDGATRRGVLGTFRRYFVRDDDIGELTEPLRFFIELFIAHQIPVSYQIIPSRLTDDCADFLLSTQRAHPQLIEFGQHGLRHEMSLKGRRLKREFGPERSCSDQALDINEGLRILRARLGSDANIAVFTPPQHKFDRNTIACAAAAGHRVFSAASYSSPHHRLAYAVGRWLKLSSIRHHGISYNGRQRPEAKIFERSISIAVDNGRAIVCDAGALPQAVASAARNTPTIGLMFHHAVYEGPVGRDVLKAIVKRLAGYGSSSFFKLSDLVDVNDDEAGEAGRI